MISPGLLTAAGGRLLPPSEGVNNVHAAIAVDIADADAVSGSEASLRYVMYDPGAIRMRRIGLCIANHTLRHVNQFGFPVAIHIAQHGDLALKCGDHLVLVPPARFAFGIDIQPHTHFPTGHAVVRETCGEDV